MKGLPQELNPFKGDEIPTKMITKPNMSQFVFFRHLDRDTESDIVDGIAISLKQGHVYFMPYSIVKERVRHGLAELL